MITWSSRLSFVACLSLLGCPSSDPAPANDSGSSGPGRTTGPTTNDSTGTTPPVTSGPGQTTSGSSTSTTASGSSSSGPNNGSTTVVSDTTGPGTSTGPEGSSSGGSSSSGVQPDCSGGDGPEFAIANMGFGAYLIDGVPNDGITLVRGCEYTFNVATPGHPFWIKTVQGTGAANGVPGVNNNGTQNGVITWTVPMAAAAGLFYNCQFHAPMTGLITVIDP